MGRKIPAKKHKGVKDPHKQQEQRLRSLMGKINVPPKDPDEQPVPRSLTRLFAFNDKQKKTKKKNIKIMHVRVDDEASQARDNPIKRLKKLPGESGRAFSLRINSAIRTLHTPGVHDNTHYPEHLEEEDTKGERIAFQREFREKKRKRAAQRAGGAGAAPVPAGEGSRLTRMQRFALKKKAKKLKVQEPAPEVMYERVAFGDVTHAPPALPAPRRPAARSPHDATRPGRRELLLSAMLRGGECAGAAASVERERREMARLDAVAAYRALKAAKYKRK